MAANLVARRQCQLAIGTNVDSVIFLSRIAGTAATSSARLIRMAMCSAGLVTAVTQVAGITGADALHKVRMVSGAALIAQSSVVHVVAGAPGQAIPCAVLSTALRAVLANPVVGTAAAAGMARASLACHAQVCARPVAITVYLAPVSDEPVVALTRGRTATSWAVFAAGCGANGSDIEHIRFTRFALSQDKITIANALGLQKSCAGPIATIHGTTEFSDNACFVHER
jgi:hypothetical protein